MATIATSGVTLEDLRFVNEFAALPGAFFERRRPDGVSAPQLAAFSPQAAALLDLRAGEERRARFTQLVAGNDLLPGMEPVAAVYAGHQFGSFVPQLGDGRAVLLGEVRTRDGAGWEVQLKGAGRTAFSRFGDGRAVLRSTIREFLCSEAMAALGIPTTRALAMVASPDRAVRETYESTAVLLRMAPSFLRFGSFEFFAASGRTAELRTLADYVVRRYYPEAGNGDDRYARMFADVVERTARLMAHWQSVGFAHGVMNTDNFSILGLTLDYGPFGFLDAYEPGFICNHTDSGGRYAFDAQPSVGLWNCYALANALLPLTAKDELEAALARYEPALHAAYLERMRAKLGLLAPHDEDEALLADLLELLAVGRVDYTLFFRALCDLDVAATPESDAAAVQMPDRDAWYAWLARYRARLASDPSTAAERRTVKRAANPKYVLRNYLAQQAIEAAQGGDFGAIGRLHEVLAAPFADAPEYEAYAAAPPEWAVHIEVSCSS